MVRINLFRHPKKVYLVFLVVENAYPHHEYYTSCQGKRCTQYLPNKRVVGERGKDYEYAYTANVGKCIWLTFLGLPYVMLCK